MKSTLFLAVLILAACCAASGQQVFMASLSSAQEVPTNSTTGKGTCKIILNAAQNAVNVSCTYSGLSSNLQAGHTHGSAAIGVNAPVLFNYNPPTGSTSGSFTAGPFTVTPTNVADMRAHRHYVNLHTVNNPGGEIRGQIKQAQTVFDRDGDGRTDAVIFRQSTNQFWTLNSNGGNLIQSHGTGTGDNWLNNTGDFDGDGIADLALIKLSGASIANWNILQSGTNTIRSVDWGDFTAASLDQLAPADYDGDGIEDIAVFRRSSALWWVIRSSDGLRTATKWGSANDQGAIGDYDGDGKADLTIVRTEGSNRVWYTQRSSDGAMTVTPFGTAATDGFFFFAPVDLDNDGKQDIVVNRAVGGQRQYHWLRSSDGGYRVFSWGASGTGSTALFGDYDGDGVTDFVARHTNGSNLVWDVFRSSDSTASYITWGLPTGDQRTTGATMADELCVSQLPDMSGDQNTNGLDRK